MTLFQIQTTANSEIFVAESRQGFNEDDVKFAKFTVGLPTTTLIPDLKQPSDEAFSDNDTTRSDTSSWTIVLLTVFGKQFQFKISI